MAAETRIFKAFAANGASSILPDFSYAGYGYGEREPRARGRMVNVSDFGIRPGTGEDMTGRIQAVVDEVGRSGGGIVYFPAGRYELNKEAEPGAATGIRINYSHTVLRGEGSGPGGTVLYQHKPMVSAQAPWLSPGLIHTGDRLFGNDRFLSPKLLPNVAVLIESAYKNDRVLSLSDTSRLKAGECILLCLQNTDDAGSLARQLIDPLPPDSAWTDLCTAGPRRSASVQWPVEVEQVLDERRVRLRQPLRRDMLLEHAPYVCLLEMLREIGVEHLRMETAWDGGGYYHHKNDEVDYGWSAICLHRVAHGWVQDVAIVDYTQGVQLRDSRNVTVRQVELLGHPGHFGMKCYAHACDCLFADIAVRAFRTHGVGIEGMTEGNVFTRIVFEGGSELDSHGGGAPGRNLFDALEGVTKISGGGAIFNLPYTGHSNTFWNIGYLHAEPKPRLTTFGSDLSGPEGERTAARRADELFYAWYWSCHLQREALDDHRMYPRSIVVGVRSVEPGRTVTISGRADDHADEWIYAEALNAKEVTPASLYEAQLALRLQREKAGR